MQEGKLDEAVEKQKQALGEFQLEETLSRMAEAGDEDAGQQLEKLEEGPGAAKLATRIEKHIWKLALHDIRSGCQTSQTLEEQLARIG